MHGLPMTEGGNRRESRWLPGAASVCPAASPRRRLPICSSARLQPRARWPGALDARLDAAALRPPALGRRRPGRSGPRALRAERRPPLHPREHREDRRQRRDGRAASAGMDGAHELVWHRTGAGRRARAAIWCSMAAAIRPGAGAAMGWTPHGPAPARAIPRGRSAAWPTRFGFGACAPWPATSSATAAGWSRRFVHPAWENYDLNWWYAAPVSGLGFNDNSVDITWGAGPGGRDAGRDRARAGLCPRDAGEPPRSPSRAIPAPPSTSSATPAPFAFGPRDGWR